MCHKDNSINMIEWKLYNNWFNWLENSFDVKPSGFIYLYSDPKICFKRIEKRSRTEESSIPLEYLTDLHNYHENWLNTCKYPVLKLDVNSEFENDPSKMKEHFYKINSFLKELQVDKYMIDNTKYLNSPYI